ncbi:MAG TPA: hypothetical protein VG452_07010 [Egibacteraceae bacterium]|nr:hypothetical protein [Actinomycetota bacterium]HWB71949.1 hypothetical protein [Egibacteraceae bacterium]
MLVALAAVLGGLVAAVTIVWAVRDHLAAGGRIRSAPLLLAWGAVGFGAFLVGLCALAALVVLAVVMASIGQWAPIDLGY